MGPLDKIVEKETKAKENDPVNHPAHYTFGKIEVIDVIEDWKLTFHLGNAVKYIARSPYKGTQISDLRKARWYLEREIDRLQIQKEPIVYRKETE